MGINDPWRIFYTHLQKFADAREDLVWASSQGVHSEAYSDASAIYSRRRAQVIEAVGQLIQMGSDSGILLEDMGSDSGILLEDMSDASEKMLKVQAEVIVKGAELETLLLMFKGSLVRVLKGALKGKVIDVREAIWIDKVGLVFHVGFDFHNWYLAREVEFV